MVRWLALVALAAVVCALPAQAFRQPPNRWRESWYDSRYGWRVAGLPATELQSTEDGGRTWHTVFRSSPPATVYIPVRTSPTAGVIGAGDWNYWTVDNGRHWQRFRIAGLYDGRDAWLYWATDRALHRIEPWPPEGAPRSRLIERVTGGAIEDVQKVPGGIVAIVNRGAGASPAVLAYRGGRRSYWTAPVLPAGTNVCELASVSVRWPLLTVVAWTANGPCGDERDRITIWHWSGARWWVAQGRSSG